MRPVDYLKALRFLFNRRPSFLVLFPTSRCNASCGHCFNWRRADTAEKRNELTVEEIEKTFKNYGHIKYLSISGGEPTLRDDIDAICQVFYRHNGLQYIALHTNGHLSKKTKRISEGIITACPNAFLNVCLSIDDIGAAHDRIRNLAENFDHIAETIQLLKGLEARHDNISISSVSVLSAVNADHMTPIHDYIVREFKIPHGITLIRGDVRDNRLKTFPLQRYTDYHNTDKQHIKTGNRYPFQSVRDAIESLTPMVITKTLQTGAMVLPCNAGRKIIVLDDSGCVYPCELTGEGLGNIREADYDINGLLASQPAGKAIAAITKNRCCCTWENVIPINLIYSAKGKWLIMRRIFGGLL